MEVIREHDKFYLKEDRKKTPKEYFKFIVQTADKYIKRDASLSFLDIGCATGDFLYYLSEVFPNAHLTGFDVMTELIDKAKKEIKKADFYMADIYSGKDIPKKKFNLIFMLGVHSIFEKFEPWIENLINLAETGTIIYVFGIFNPEDLDVLIRIRKSDSNGPWESGWNLFSKKSIGKYLKKKGLEYKFIDWNINIDIAKNKEDCLRSWTIGLQNGSREVVNGIQLLHKFYLLEIKV